MPIGLKNASAHFQWVVNTIYGNVRCSSSGAQINALQAILAAYQDDVNAGSDTLAQHLSDLRLTMYLTRSKNLRFKLSKCLFGRRKVDTWGHMVSHQCILSSDKHVQVMANFREPTNAFEFLRFLGCLQFFANHIPKLSKHARPLYDMLVGTQCNKNKRKVHPVQLPNWHEKWSDPQREAFRRLRENISQTQFLVLPRAGSKRRLVTDASQCGL